MTCLSSEQMPGHEPSAVAVQEAAYSHPSFSVMRTVSQADISSWATQTFHD